MLIAGDRVAAVDWETAALGPAAIDLAALITGWDASARARIVAAYGGMEPADLAAAELLLALKWLGRSDGFQVPPEHRRDWLSEARRAAELLTCAS